MQDQSIEQDVWGTPERAALWAAASGFTMSFVFLMIYGVSAELQPGAARVQSSLETLFVFLWPSSILLLGAQTVQGKIVLFLLSAFLNAGYYTFVALFACAVLEKFRSRSLAAASINSADHRVNPAVGIADRMTATRPAA